MCRPSYWLLSKCSLVLLCVLGVSVPSQGADADRGQVLYDAWCDRCHAAGVHVRKARRAKSFLEIRAQVSRWSAELGAPWTDAEIDAVTRYLNRRYYAFPCPQNVCGVGQASIGRASADFRIEGR